MKRILATEEQLKVKKGDRVAVSGYRGTVTEVYIDETEDYIKVQFISMKLKIISKFKFAFTSIQRNQ